MVIDNIEINDSVIFLIHKDRVLRRKYSKLLTTFAKLHEFDSISKFIEELDRSQPNLIIFDQESFEYNQLEIVQSVKKNDKLKDIPMFLSLKSDNAKAKLAYRDSVSFINEDHLDTQLITQIQNTLNSERLANLAREQTKFTQKLENDYEAEYKKIKQELSQTKQEIEMAHSQIDVLRVQDKTLHRIGKTIRKSFDMKSNLRQVVDDLSGIYNLDCCFITLPGEIDIEDTIRCESYSNEAYSIVENDLDLKILEIFRQNFNCEEPLVISDTTIDPRYKVFGKSLLSNIAINSLFYFPVSHENKLLGILGGIKVESAGKWSTDNENFLLNVANDISNGVINSRLYAAVQRQATIDGLTGLLNHRTGQEKLSEQLKIAERYQRNLSVMMIDVDFFKSINDTHGHPAGDTVLRAVARLIKNNCRDVDIAVRYGGEEFMLILPEIPQEAAIVVAERIRKNLSSELIMHDKIEIKITASIGISSYPEDAKNQTKLLSLADRALYLSKRLGRNQVHSAPDLLYEEIMGNDPPQAPINKNPFIKSVELPSISQNAKEQEELVPEVIEMVKALAGSLYSRSDYNKAHHIETAKLAETLAKFMGLPKRDIEQIRVAGLLHDVGTLAIPSDLLEKTGQMNRLEKEALKEHVVIGVEMLKPIRALKDICEILENHHERFDGTGYPKGLKGEEIPLAARIVSIVDSFHAMISNRPYRKAMSVEDAILVLRQESGKQFDPLIVDIFITIIKDIYNKK